jgi:glycosyltransferase involved in cell wall biosynthesis
MRIAYVTAYDPNNRSNWSGLGHAIMNSLKAQGIDVTCLGPLANNFCRIGNAKARIYRHLLHRSYGFERSTILGRDYAWQVRRHLRKSAYDIVFSPSTIPISRLGCREPVVIWVDATWASYLPLYEQQPPWCQETVQAGHTTERLAYDRCYLIIFSSQWAADSAINDYGVDPQKVRVIPFGANFEVEIDRARVLHSISERAAGRCNLISIGTEWHRKGMGRSIELAAMLNSGDLPTELIIVGCTPPPGTQIPSFVKVIGFIDKRSVEEERRLSSLLLQAHFHVLLSRGDCSPVVFSEATAHGVPNITFDVGGAASIVINNKGGFCFSPQQSISEIAAYIKSHVLDREGYMLLARNARREYEDRLNWSVSGAAVKRELEAIMRQVNDRRDALARERQNASK